MITRERREPVKVEFHQNGYTRVVYERVPCCGIDIPTATIPPHLRSLGSRFVLVFFGITPEQQDTIDELRAASRIEVEELNEGDC